MTGDDVKTAIAAIAVVVAIASYIRTHVSDSGKANSELLARVSVIETKIGLFWHLVEDNMADIIAKNNPIHLEPHEQIAADIYKIEKRNAPTHVLKVLDQAINREIVHMTPDEKAAFSMIQGAIRSQLVDRHEYPYRNT